MNYSDYAEIAKEKIDEYGGACSITRKGSATYNKATNTWTSQDTVINGKAILGNFDMANVNGSSVQVGDVSITAIFESAPVVGDVIDFGGKKYNAVNISEVNPDGSTVILYRIQAR